MRRAGIIALVVLMATAWQSALCAKVSATGHAVAACCGESCLPPASDAAALQCCTKGVPAETVAARPVPSRAAGSLDLFASTSYLYVPPLPAAQRLTVALTVSPPFTALSPERLCSLQI